MSTKEEFRDRRPEAVEAKTEADTGGTAEKFNQSLLEAHPELAQEIAAVADGSKKPSDASWTKFPTKFESTAENESTSEEVLDPASPAGALHGLFEKATAGWNEEQKKELASHVAELLHAPVRAALEASGVTDPLTATDPTTRNLEMDERSRFQANWDASLAATANALATGNDESFAFMMKYVGDMTSDVTRWQAGGEGNTAEARAAELIGPDRDWREITLRENRDLMFELGSYQSGYSREHRREWAEDAATAAVQDLVGKAQQLEASGDPLDQAMGQYLKSETDAARVNLMYGTSQQDRALYDHGIGTEAKVASELENYLASGTVPNAPEETDHEHRWGRESRRALEEANRLIEAND